MQFRKNFLLSIFGMLVLAQPASAQEIITNDRGEKIIAYPDGRWKYFHKEENESLLFDESDGEGEEETISDIDEAKALNHSEVSLKEAILAAERARASEKRLARELVSVQLKKKKLELNFDVLREEGMTPESELDLLRLQLQKTYRVEDYLLNQHIEIEREADILEKMIFMKMDRRDRMLANQREAGKQKDGSSKKLKEEIGVGEFVPEVTSPQPPEKRFKEYDPAEDLIRHPPPLECRMLFVGKDEFTGKLHREVAPQIFFNHTPDALRKYLPNTEYLTCLGNLVSMEGGFRFLNLEFIIVSPNAKRSFGSLPQNSTLTIKLLDGTAIRLQNKIEDSGMYDSKLKSFIYRGQYAINTGQEKLLRKEEVDKVRVVWSSGYEDYEVYEVDFLKDQFKCLDKSFK